MRYVGIHGYQPPRENPSLEAIELQDSAYPYHVPSSDNGPFDRKAWREELTQFSERLKIRIPQATNG